MSKTATKAADVFFPGSGTVAAAGTDATIGALTPDLPSTDVPQRGDTTVKNDSQQVATREQQQRIALVASGITPTANERDKLGGGLNTKSASRLLLGGR